MYPAILALCLVLWTPLLQADGGSITIVDTTFFLNPGADQLECFRVGAGQLTLTASSPPGRTGETAYVELAPGGPQGPMLVAPLTAEDLTATFAVDDGRYCYRLRISRTTPDPFDPSRPERPTKQVNLRLVSRWS